MATSFPVGRRLSVLGRPARGWPGLLASVRPEGAATLASRVLGYHVHIKKTSPILAAPPSPPGALLEWASFFRPEPPSWLLMPSTAALTTSPYDLELAS